VANKEIPMHFAYEDLEITKLARELIKKVYQFSLNFPREEMFSLTSQLRRSSISVLLNIAEGSGRYYKKDYAKFVRNSVGSLIEIDGALKIAIDQKYFSQEKYSQELSPIIEKLFFKLIAFEKSLIGKRP
jgi:four helix bundle protein